MRNIVYLLLLIFSAFQYGQTANEKLALDEAKRRNISTKSEALTELNKNGISLSQAQEMAKMQGIDLNTFLSQNFGSNKTTTPTNSTANDTVDKITLVTENFIEDTNPEVITAVDVDPDDTYFGYSIFDNNPFATKDYLVGNIDEGYLLSPGDELRITVFGNNALTTESKIDLNGNIIFPEMGVFQAAGNSLKTIKSRLKIFLGKFYNGLISSPQQAFIDVSLTQIRPVKVNVLGQVVSPGPHLVNGLASVLNALYAAGGVKTSGSLRTIKLYRNNKLLKEIDLYDYITKGNIDEDLRLMSSDVVFVQPRLNSIRLDGSVFSSAIFELKQGEKLNDLIKFSGGLKSDASLENINISRIVPFNNRSQEQVYNRFLTTIDYTDFDDFELLDGDLITIDKILDKTLNIVSLNGNVENPGNYSITKYPDLKTLITEAGQGIAPNTYMEKIDIEKIDDDGVRSFKTYNLRSILDGKIKVNLEQDDNVIIYSLSKVEGEKKINISGFGVDAKTIFWREGLSLFDVIFESTSFEELEFQSELLTSRVDVDSFNPLSGNYKTNIYSLENLITLKQIIVSPKDKIRLYSKSVSQVLNKSIEVTGSVNNPSTFDLKDNMLVEDAILLAGGLNEYADNKISIIRKDDLNYNFSETFNYNIDLDYLTGLTKSPKNPFFLKDKDIISAKTVIRANLNPTATIIGEVNIPGVYALENLKITFRDLLSKASDETEFSFLNSTQFFRNGELISYSSKNSLLNQIVAPDDRFIVGSTLMDVKITGTGLNNPTSSNWYKGKRAKYYIKKGGKIKKRIDSKIIIRKNGSSKKINNLFSNPKIYPGDIIIVNQKPEKENSENSFIDQFSTIFGLISGTLTTILLVTKL